MLGNFACFVFLNTSGIPADIMSGLIWAQKVFNGYQYQLYIYKGLDARKPEFGVCEQQRRRTACAFPQTD